MTLLQEYIVQQPALWRALLDSREEITGAFARRFGDLRPDRVVLIGSGSSHYAALMARPVLERAWGAEVTCLVPSEAAGTRLTGERPLYLAISQSGVSTNTYELVTALTGAGHPVAAVTERADSPVGSAATLAVTLRIGEERIGAKTKGRHRHRADADAAGPVRLPGRDLPGGHAGRPGPAVPGRGGEPGPGPGPGARPAWRSCCPSGTCTCWAAAAAWAPPGRRR